MSTRLITPINIGDYGGEPDYRCCQSAATSYVSGFPIAESGDLATRDRHGFQTGDEVILESLTGGAGLSASTHYYVYVVSSSEFKLCSSFANAQAGTAVNVTTNATNVTLSRVVSNPHYGITSRRFDSANTTPTETTASGSSPLEISLNTSQTTAGTQFSSTVRFGVCCAYDITLDLSGWLRATVSGLDSIEILQNGVQVYYKESDATEGHDWWRDNMGVDPVTNPHATYPFTDSVTIIMDQQACGDVIEIRCLSNSVHATEAEGSGFSIGWTITVPPL